MKKIIIATLIATVLASPALALISIPDPLVDVPRGIPTIDGDAVKEFYTCLFFGKCDK
jgi:hypothetical protein